ncbi:MAG: SRPBCC family protein [Solirubrobacteraceae bacterium]
MDPIELSITIDRPREEVFEYLADIANHPEFTDHYLKEWHLTRVDSYGRGAGARFRTDAPRQRFSWGDMSFVTVEAPRHIVAVGRGGKFNRIKTFAEWTLEPAGHGTRVEFVFETEPALPTDRLIEAFGYRGWTRRNANKGLKRLRGILEDNEGRGVRATVAGI